MREALVFQAPVQVPGSRPKTVGNSLARCLTRMHTRTIAHHSLAACDSSWEEGARRNGGRDVTDRDTKHTHRGSARDAARRNRCDGPLRARSPGFPRVPCRHTVRSSAVRVVAPAAGPCCVASGHGSSEPFSCGAAAGRTGPSSRCSGWRQPRQTADV